MTDFADRLRHDAHTGAQYQRPTTLVRATADEIASWRGRFTGTVCEELLGALLAERAYAARMERERDEARGLLECAQAIAQGRLR